MGQKVGTMSGGERQSLAIARAEYRGARLLILDEPTSALGVNEAAIVLRHVIRARARGLGVVFITHNVHHALPIGDRFVILSRGRVAGTYPRARDRRGGAQQAHGRRRRVRRAPARAGGAGAAAETLGRQRPAPDAVAPTSSPSARRGPSSAKARSGTPARGSSGGSTSGERRSTATIRRPAGTMSSRRRNMSARSPSASRAAWSSPWRTGSISAIRATGQFTADRRSRGRPAGHPFQRRQDRPPGAFLVRHGLRGPAAQDGICRAPSTASTPTCPATAWSSGIGSSNGLAFSPDSRTMYFADSQGGFVWAWDFDPASGDIANRRRLHRLPRHRRLRRRRHGRRRGLLLVDAAGNRQGLPLRSRRRADADDSACRPRSRPAASSAARTSTCSTSPRAAPEAQRSARRRALRDRCRREGPVAALFQGLMPKVSVTGET